MIEKEVYLSGTSYVLGEIESITEILELQEEPMSMENFLGLGLESYAITKEEPYQMAVQAAKETISKTEKSQDRIDVVIYATETFGDVKHTREDIRKFCTELGLNRAYPYGLFLSECANIQAGIKMAAGMIISGNATNILLVTTDKVIDGETRILPPSLGILSDSAAACIISSEKPKKGFQILNTFSWTDPELYFVDPTKNFKDFFQRTVAGVKSVGVTILENEGLHPTDIKGVIVNNYNTSIMYTLVTQIGFTLEKTCLNNLSRFAHAFAADNLINLETLCEDTQSETGDMFLVTASGPTTWGATLVKQL